MNARTHQSLPMLVLLCVAAVATSRAFAVHKLNKEENSIAEITKVEGIGPTYSAEMNSTPEGRYYCRTVTVQVQTPLKTN